MTAVGPRLGDNGEFLPTEGRMEIYCHCDGVMRLVSHETLEERIEQKYECPECDEAVLIVKDRKWQETLPGD